MNNQTGFPGSTPGEAGFFIDFFGAGVHGWSGYGVFSPGL
jgi:hypothetical protein